MTKLSESIIGKIKCDKITPVPRWHFLIKGYTFWSLFCISVIFGSLSFSVIVHVINSGDIDIWDHLQGSLFSSAVMLLPIFWILFLILFATLAYLNWKCTKLGYCVKRRWIVLGSVAFSMIFGGVFYSFGLGKQADGMMTRALPFYDQYKHRARKDLWQQPERGLLTGKIIDIDEENEKLLIRDENGQNWIIDDRDIKWENMALEEKGKIIKAIGKINGDAEFEAIEIRKCTNCQDDEFVEDIPAGVCFKPQAVSAGCGR